jgi:GTPase
MENTEKLYHIYAKDRCIYHSLPESKFSETWDMLHKMVELLGANISKEDLQYEEVTVNKLIAQNASY